MGCRATWDIHVCISISAIILAELQGRREGKHGVKWCSQPLQGHTAVISWLATPAPPIMAAVSVVVMVVAATTIDLPRQHSLFLCVSQKFFFWWLTRWCTWLRSTSLGLAHQKVNPARGTAVGIGLSWAASLVWSGGAKVLLALPLRPQAAS